MWKKVLAAGGAVLTLGIVSPAGSDLSPVPGAAVCEGAVSNAPEGIPYSVPLGYSTSIQKSEMYCDGRVIMQGSTYEVNLDGRSAEKYPKLQTALENLSKDNWGYMRKMMNRWEGDLKEQYRARSAEGWPVDKDVVPFCYDLSYSGLRADSSVFSCVGTEYIFLGGAHPVTYYRAHTFDTNSGKALKAEDVFETTNGLAKIIVDETIAQNEAQTRMMNKEEAVRSVQKMIDSHTLQFGMTEEALVVYFGSYAVGPYAMGTMEVKIPYMKYMKMFNDKYVFYGEKAKG